MVHVRRIGDRELTFIVSGKLWRNSLIMMDKETGSLWSHITGECLEGELVGKKLEQWPSVQTSWQEWSAEHGTTRVLEKSEELKSSRYTGYFEDPDRNGLFRSFWLEERLPGKTLIHGITLGPHALAVADEALPVGGSVVGDLGGQEVEIRRGDDGGVVARLAEGGDELLVRTAFYFAWSGFFPNTLVID